jgi:PemK-like, MazF-like toxin of type II toxin-antitoxin system
VRRLLRHIANKVNQLTGRGRTPVPAPPRPPATTAAKKSATRPAARRPTAPARAPAKPPKSPAKAPAAARAGRSLVYAPQLDGRADPGEIVWTWVAYEDDPSQGKDRPVLVVGRDGAMLQGLMLSSNSEREGQRHWFGLGEGTWDREHRPSWVRLDRVLTVNEGGIRREGAVLDRRRFALVAAQLREHYGWR